MPQPKSASIAPQTDPAAAKSLDVATAIKNVVTPTTNVSTTANTKQDATVTAPVEDLAPKSEAPSPTNAPLPSVIELRLAPEKTEMTVGEKRQFAVELKSEAPLGLAVLMMRFDPNVIKINSVAAGKMFADAKSAPSVTQSMDQKGVLLVSVAPGANSHITGEGSLLNLEVEALAAGNSSLSFDLSNLHLVTSDGRTTVLELTPMSLTVKPASAPPTPPAPAPKPASDETSALAPALSPKTELAVLATSLEAAIGNASMQQPASKSYVVQQRDNLWKIAKLHGVTFAALRQANPQLRGDVLTVGREIVIP
jgi:LysM repeat protein